MNKNPVITKNLTQFLLDSSDVSSWNLKNAFKKGKISDLYSNLWNYNVKIKYQKSKLK